MVSWCTGCLQGVFSCNTDCAYLFLSQGSSFVASKIGSKHDDGYDIKCFTKKLRWAAFFHDINNKNKDQSKTLEKPRFETWLENTFGVPERGSEGVRDGDSLSIFENLGLEGRSSEKKVMGSRKVEA